MIIEMDVMGCRRWQLIDGETWAGAFVVSIGVVGDLEIIDAGEILIALI